VSQTDCDKKILSRKPEKILSQKSKKHREKFLLAQSQSQVDEPDLGREKKNRGEKKVGRYSKNIQKNIQKIFKKYSKNIRKIFEKIFDT